MIVLNYNGKIYRYKNGVVYTNLYKKVDIKVSNQLFIKFKKEIMEENKKNYISIIYGNDKNNNITSNINSNIDKRLLKKYNSTTQQQILKEEQRIQNIIKQININKYASSEEEYKRIKEERRLTIIELTEKYKEKKLEQERLKKIYQEKKEMEIKEKLLKDLKNKKILLKKLKEYEFEGFLHTSDLENFISIYKAKFLYSRKFLNENNINFIDNAEPNIISNTNDSILSKVRFYYRPITPTNVSAFKNHNQKHPVILVFNENIIFDSNCYFCDGCAKSKNTIITKDPQKAISFKWEMIFDNKSFSESDKLKNEIGLGPIHYKNAEFLYPNKISLDKLVKVYFRTKKDMNEVINKVGFDDRFILNENKFYRGCNDYLF